MLVVVCRVRSESKREYAQFTPTKSALLRHSVSKMA